MMRQFGVPPSRRSCSLLEGAGSRPWILNADFCRQSEVSITSSQCRACGRLSSAFVLRAAEQVRVAPSTIEAGIVQGVLCTLNATRCLCSSAHALPWASGPLASPVDPQRHVPVSALPSRMSQLPPPDAPAPESKCPAASKLSLRSRSTPWPHISPSLPCDLPPAPCVTICAGAVTGRELSGTPAPDPE